MRNLSFWIHDENVLHNHNISHYSLDSSLTERSKSVFYSSTIGRIMAGWQTWQHQPWEDVCVAPLANRGIPPIQAQTGYSKSVLETLWSGAKQWFMMVPDDSLLVGHMKPRVSDFGRSQHYFYVFLMYIHLYPTNSMPDILRTTRFNDLSTGGISYGAFYSCVTVCKTMGTVY